MQRFQGVLVVFLAFLIGANCVDFENSTASGNETESVTVDFHCASSPCTNGGTCINEGGIYTCMCPEEYGGKDCSESRVCEVYGEELCGNATCFHDEKSDDYSCTCEDGKIYDVSLNGCRVDHCASNPCKNGGTCRNQGDTYTCFCRIMYSGKNCSKYLWCDFNGRRACGEATCHYNTVSRRVSCSCPSNQEFDEELKICKSPCKPDPCIRGRCIEIGEHDFSCICPSSYTGKFCNETIIDACTSNPCQSGGTCYAIGREFRCICKYFYSGNTCEHGNAATIGALVVSLTTVAILSVLCGLFCYKRNQTLKKKAKPEIHMAPVPATASAHGQTNLYPTVPRF